MRITLFPILLLALVACSRGIDNKEAVRQGVIDHLTTKANLNISGMSVDITSVAFKGDEADATVSFVPKGGKAVPGQGMTMRYTLQKQGNRWVVKGRADSGMSPHGGAVMPGMPGADMPPGHPTMPKPDQPGTKK